MLEQLQADHEGFSAGPLAALQQSQHVLGSLADRIRVPDQYVDGHRERRWAITCNWC